MRGHPRILAILEVARGDRPAPAVNPPSLRIEARQFLPLGVVLVFSEEELASIGDEQDALRHIPPRGNWENPAGGAAVESQRKGPSPVMDRGGRIAAKALRPKQIRAAQAWPGPTMARKPRERKYKRLFLAADLHGSEITFRKFLAAATFYDVDALLIGGDLTAKSITPIVQQRDGHYQTRLAGAARDNLTEAELEPIEKAIADSGPYPVRMTEDDYARFRANPDKVESLFTDRMIDQIRRWTEMAERHLAPLDIPLFWIGGNDDKSEALLHAESTPHVRFIDEKVVRFDEDHEILGFGWTNPSPWRTPRELSEDRLKKRLDPLLSRVEDPAHAIYLMHAPPYETGLDIAPKLDTSTDPPRPVTQGGQQVLIPVGSTSFRTAILETQPLLGLHGHIHETKNAAKLKKSVLVDPGSEYNMGTLRGAIINIERDRVLSYQFTTG